MTLTLDKPRVVDDHLVCGYSYSNDSARALYLRCLVGDLYGLSEDLRLDRSAADSAVPTPELAYVTWAGEGHAVLLLGSTPLAATGSERVAPLAVCVPAGARFRAAIRSRLPLLEWHDGLAPYERPAEPVAIERVTLLLECVSERDDAPPPLPSLPEAWKTRDRGSRIARAEALLREPITMYRRTDEVLRIPVNLP